MKIFFLNLLIDVIKEPNKQPSLSNSDRWETREGESVTKKYLIVPIGATHMNPHVHVPVYISVSLGDWWWLLLLSNPWWLNSGIFQRMHMCTHMHTQINIALEQCRVLDLTHIIICNLWHQSRSDTLEGWQQACISSTHLITQPITHAHATRFRWRHSRLATRKSGSRTNSATLLNIPVKITDDETRWMWRKMHTSDPHLWRTRICFRF